MSIVELDAENFVKYEPPINPKYYGEITMTMLSVGGVLLAL